MMTVNPKRRITIKQVLLHPWLQDRELRDSADTLLTREDDENVAPSNIHDSNQNRNDQHPGLIKRARLDIQT